MQLERLWQRLPGELRQFTLYAICGVTAVALDFAIYVGLLAFDVWYQIANAAGYLVGTFLSFILNRWFTFKVLDAPARRLLVFLAVACVGYASSVLSLWVLIDRSGVDPYPAKITSIVLVVAIQYCLNSRWTFR